MDAPIDLRPIFRDAWPSYGPAWDRGVELGIDVADLEHNLQLTPEQRIVQHQRTLRVMEAMRAAVDHARDR